MYWILVVYCSNTSFPDTAQHTRKQEVGHAVILTERNGKNSEEVTIGARKCGAQRIKTKEERE